MPGNLLKLASDYGAAREDPCRIGSSTTAVRHEFPRPPRFFSGGIMIHLFLSVCILIASAAGTLVSAHAAEDTTISILSPLDGETVTETFNLTYEILNGPKENQAQVYLDGVHLKEFEETFSHVP